ncbi:unnamed protein product, partial [Mesorhabditis belari]|uniref:Uncharacterized protein n=1 Tax=Mesorhabditis belari TaxID=2138241 RepID=A0AAF3J6N9_9BILA
MPRRRGFGLASLRKDLHLHNLFRSSQAVPQSPSIPEVTSVSRESSQDRLQRIRPNSTLSQSTTFSGEGVGHLGPPSGHHGGRRESFLYRPSEDTRELGPRPVSRASSVTSSDPTQGWVF